MTRYILLGCSILLFTICRGATYVRYNIVGYDPSATKEVVVMSDASCNGNTWSLKNSSNIEVASGALSGNGTGTGDYMPLAFNYKINFTSVTGIGNYTLTVQNVAPVTIRIACKPYNSFLPLILRTIRVRRSASVDALDHGYSHGKDSSAVIWRRNGTNNGSWSVDGANTKVNMIGGHYDAGDYIKFTLTEAYMVYHLLRSYQAAPSLFDGVKTYSTTVHDDLLDECKWGLDYLMRTQPSTAEFVIQMGGAADHQQWPQRLPENDALNGTRECYSIRSKTQMGMTAAALALGAKVFSDKGYTTLANEYRNKAIQIYSSAKASSINSAWWQGGSEIFYADDTQNDNMQLAAIELYLLTGTNSYLTDATNGITATGAAGWSSWGNVNLQAHLRTLTFAGAAATPLNSDLATFRTNAQRANNLWGIPHESVWGSNASQMSVAHGSLSHKVATGLTTNTFMAQNVIDYLFGRNPWGICFIANTTYSPSITTSYAPIYKLQPTKFPYGEIAAGPAPASDHAAQTAYFFPAHNANLWFKNFNTSKYTFFEQSGDYVCMETIITQLADAFYLLTLASKEGCNNPLTFEESIEKKSYEGNAQIVIRQEGRRLYVDNQLFDRVSFIDMTGRILGDWPINSAGIDLSSQGSGIFLGYFYSSNHAEKLHVQKILVE